MDNQDDGLDSIASLSGLTPEQIQALLASIGDPAELQGLQGQSDIADKLRNYQPEAGTMAGRVYVPNIAGAVTQIGSAYAGNKLAQKTDQAREGIYKREASSLEGYLSAKPKKPVASFGRFNPANPDIEKV